MDALSRKLEKTENSAINPVDFVRIQYLTSFQKLARLKRDELLATAPPVAIDLMRRVKKVFDPARIMNPGKVI